MARRRAFRHGVTGGGLGIITTVTARLGSPGAEMAAETSVRDLTPGLPSLAVPGCCRRENKRCLLHPCVVFFLF